MQFFTPNRKAPGISPYVYAGLYKAENLKGKEEYIIIHVANFFDVPINALKGKRRITEIVVPRQICIYMLHKYTTLSLKGIGNMMGGRDHSTVIHTIKKIENLKKTDKVFSKLITKVKLKLGV